MCTLGSVPVCAAETLQLLSDSAHAGRSKRAQGATGVLRCPRAAPADAAFATAVILSALALVTLVGKEILESKAAAVTKK